MANKRSRASTKRNFTKWHRRLGIASALVVVLISVSGVLLNHSDRLGLPGAGVKSPWLLSLYNIEIPEVIVFDSGTASVAQLGHQLYLGYKAVGECRGQLVGAVYLEKMHYIACSETLVILSDVLQLVERIEPAHGLPAPLTALGSAGTNLVVGTPQQVYEANSDNLDWQPVSINSAAPHWSPALEADEKLERRLRENYTSDISWERVVLDFHAARFLGKAGALFLDFFALSFIALGLTGCWLWVRGRKVR